MEDKGMPQIGAGSVIDPVDQSPGGTHKPEEIVGKLRQVDVLVSQGQSVAEAVRSIGVTRFTYYRWRKEYGGLKTNQVRRLKELEKDRAIEAPLVRAQWRGSGFGKPSPI
jgi:putative transposase